MIDKNLNIVTNFVIIKFVQCILLLINLKKEKKCKSEISFIVTINMQCWEVQIRKFVWLNN